MKIIYLLLLIILVDNFRGYRDKRKNRLVNELNNNLYSQNKRFYLEIQMLRAEKKERENEI